MLTNFSPEHKSAAVYLDLAANAHGEEKGSMVLRALSRTNRGRPHVVEIGPGGGAAVAYLAQQLGDQCPSRPIDLTLVEAPGVTSESLRQAIDQFGHIGACTVLESFAQNLAGLITAPVDVISASSLLHEMYSYSGGYSGLHAMIRVLSEVLNPYGFVAYRDVYAVEAASLHERVTQSYTAPSWLRFLRLFLPHYLNNGVHPYHHADDQVVIRQNSAITSASDLDITTTAVITAPIGVFREVQRHYITARDHLWRSGTLGIRPVLEGQLASDWLDRRSGHKRVHYALTDAEAMPEDQALLLRAMSEPFADHFVICGDVFDSVTDVAVTSALASAETDSAHNAWEGWLAREGTETYAYLTLSELITAFAENSVESGSILLPVEPDDISRVDRDYYNRFLARQLPNPLPDAKQLVLFQLIPLRDVATIRRAVDTIQRVCSKDALARIYTAINGGQRPCP